jgi:glutaredoxin
MKKSTKKYPPPLQYGYTMYSITGCKYCDKSKELIKSKSKECKTNNCDKYVATLRDSDDFYAFMNRYTVQNYKYFPMIFYNNKFIGGYQELMLHINKL